MIRFFIESTPSVNAQLVISGEDFNHLRVLRPKIGELIELCNPAAKLVYLAGVDQLSKNDARITILSSHAAGNEPTCKISLFQAIPKTDKMELLIQKGVELGLAEITPILTSRTQAHRANVGAKATRWQKISKEAAQQSRRDIVPPVHDVDTFSNVLSKLSRFDGVFVANENETTLLASRAFKDIDATNVAMFVGPEGGFEASEVAALLAHGAMSVSLGKRILRTETAAITMVALILSAKGDI